MNIQVTKWFYDADDVLILKGSADSTRKEASQYFQDSPASVKFEECEMDKDEFDRLPEFQT